MPLRNYRASSPLSHIVGYAKINIRLLESRWRTSRLVTDELRRRQSLERFCVLILAQFSVQFFKQSQPSEPDCPTNGIGCRLWVPKILPCEDWDDQLTTDNVGVRWVTVFLKRSGRRSRVEEPFWTSEVTGSPTWYIRGGPQTASSGVVTVQSATIFAGQEAMPSQGVVGSATQRR